jgi:hypothetical protein
MAIPEIAPVSWRRAIKWFALTLLGGVATVAALGSLVILWALDPLNLSAPSDRELLATFRDHREAFDRLRELAADQRTAGYLTATDTSKDFDTNQKKEFEAILTGLSSHLIVTVDWPRVRFIFAGGGLSAISPGWLKGIQYIPDDEPLRAPLVANLDNAFKQRAGVYLRMIEPNWYILYQRTDD